MGKTRDLFMKIRDTKGTFHAKKGSIKDRNGMDLTEAEDIKKRWQEYTEELYEKYLHHPDNHDGVITHLGPDILECEVKWTLGSITMNKASEFSSVQFSHSVVSNSFQPHELQHTRPPCPSPLLEFTQTQVHTVSDAIQPSHLLSSLSPPAPNSSQHQSLFQ